MNWDVHPYVMAAVLWLAAASPGQAERPRTVGWEQPYQDAANTSAVHARDWRCRGLDTAKTLRVFTAEKDGAKPGALGVFSRVTLADLEGNGHLVALFYYGPIFGPSEITALDLNSLKIVWKTTVPGRAPMVGTLQGAPIVVREKNVARNVVVNFNNVKAKDDEVQGGFVKLAGRDGTPIWRADFPPDFLGVYGMVVADLDGDGASEIVCTSHIKGKGKASPRGCLRVFSSAGQALWDFVPAGSPYNAPAVGYVPDRQGKKALILFHAHGPYSPQRETIFCLDGAGKKLWHFQMEPAKDQLNEFNQERRLPANPALPEYKILAKLQDFGYLPNVVASFTNGQQVQLATGSNLNYYLLAPDGRLLWKAPHGTKGYGCQATLGADQQVRRYVDHHANGPWRSTTAAFGTGKLWTAFTIPAEHIQVEAPGQEPKLTWLRRGSVLVIDHEGKRVYEMPAESDTFLFTDIIAAPVLEGGRMALIATGVEGYLSKSLADRQSSLFFIDPISKKVVGKMKIDGHRYLGAVSFGIDAVGRGHICVSSGEGITDVVVQGDWLPPLGTPAK